MAKHLWLFKSDPESFSIQDLERAPKKTTAWDGVRNYQARNNMRAMKVGDLGFFYHSNDPKAVVGILEVIGLVHPDPKDDTGTWECVDVRAIDALPRPVSLDEIKTVPELSEMVLVKSSRLSVQPVTAKEWEIVCRMGGLKTAKAKSKA